MSAQRCLAWLYHPSCPLPLRTTACWTRALVATLHSDSHHILVRGCGLPNPHPSHLPAGIGYLNISGFRGVGADRAAVVGRWQGFQFLHRWIATTHPVLVSRTSDGWGRAVPGVASSRWQTSIRTRGTRGSDTWPERHAFRDARSHATDTHRLTGWLCK